MLLAQKINIIQVCTNLNSDWNIAKKTGETSPRTDRTTGIFVRSTTSTTSDSPFSSPKTDTSVTGVQTSFFLPSENLNTSAMTCTQWVKM